jgi:serine/threonine protein kinase
VSIDKLLRDLAESFKDEMPAAGKAARAFTEACRQADDDPRERQRLSDLADLLDAEETLYAEARAALERGDKHGALPLLRQCAKTGTGEAHWMLAQLLEDLGRPDEAVTWYQHAADDGDSRAAEKLARLSRKPRSTAPPVLSDEVRARLAAAVKAEREDRNHGPSIAKRLRAGQVAKSPATSLNQGSQKDHRSGVRALQPQDPQLIGPYRLVGQLGAGGMGRVFLGMSAGGRPVAVKIIRAELAADPEFRTRFRREVTAARRVNGLFTALVVDADVDAAVPWLATAYVPAPSLAKTINESGPLSPRAVLSLAAGLAEGLVAIHSVGVVHGDLKPSNVLLAEDGPRVIDFGLSQAAGAAPVTPTGLVVGSPGFMSPEQALGRNVGPLSDVFSLGAVLAYAATGERPFGAGSPVELLDRVVHGAPRLDAVPAEVRSLCRRCLARDPDQRPSAGEILAEMGDVHFAPGWLPASHGMFTKNTPADDETLGGPRIQGSYIPKLFTAPPIDAANREDQWELTDQEITDFFTGATPC